MTTTTATPDTLLAAYWDSGICGPHGEDYQWEWCGKTAGDCKDTVQTDKCPSGEAQLVSVQGDRTCCASVNIGGCNYAYYAQYECKTATPDTLLAAYWDS